LADGRCPCVPVPFPDMSVRWPILSLVFLFSLSCPPASSSRPLVESSGVGIVSAVQGNLFVARRGADRPTSVQALDSVHVYDALQTDSRSRAKILLEDDVLLALGENSRVEIIPGSPGSSQEHRSLIFNLSQGRLRVIIGRQLSGLISGVELHTPTAVVTAREGSFAAWVEPQTGSGNSSFSTRVTNLGRSSVDMSAAGQVVTLTAGQSSLALSSRPPSSPELVRTAFPESPRAVSDTYLQDRRKPQTPRETLMANGGMETQRARRPTVVTSDGSRAQPPLVPMTPPAVISGAVTTQNLTGSPSPTGPSVTPNPTNQPTSSPVPTPAPATAPAPTPPPPPAPSPSPVVTPAPAPSNPSPISLPKIELPKVKLPKIDLKD
jgi:hypothetical protein